MRKATLVAIAALVVSGTLLGATGADARPPAAPSIVQEIDQLRKKTNRIRRTIGRRMYRADFAYRTIDDRAVRLEALIIWTQRFKKARRLTPHPNSVWARLADCESGGDWAYNGTVIYDGGLQFHPQTWNSYRRNSYPKFAWQATPYQQIRAAKRLRRGAGWGAWPSCSAKLGLR